MTTPPITVAIPFFDEERHLGDAIRSVLGQTFGDFDLLLVDDGSTDGSLAIARSFDDPRIRVLSDGARRGLPARLNEIVRHARTELVARMDADDVIHPTRIARQRAVLEADPMFDVVGSWAGLVDEHDEPFAVSESAELPPSPWQAIARGVMAHASILARRSWHLHNPYDETLTRAEDRDLWCRTAATSRFAVVPEILYVVRVATDDERFLSDYVDAHRQNRVIYRRHGPSMVGLGRTARLVGASFAKGWIMRGSHAAGLSSLLVRRRGRPPTAEERARILEALAAGRQPP